MARLQWSIIVDRLTYDKSWSADRVSSVLLGIINLGLISISYLHHIYWLIPLGLINSTALVYSMANKNLFENLLKQLGFEEKESILIYQKNQLKAKEKIEENENNFEILTTNQSNVFVFEIYSSYANIHTFNNSEAEQ